MNKNKKRTRRKMTIRRKISGSAARPRLCMYRGNRNIYAQLVDDISGRVVASILAGGANITFAKSAGSRIAEMAQGKGIKEVVFDRSGYRYHGVVKALADAAREKGLKF